MPAEETMRTFALLGALAVLVPACHHRRTIVVEERHSPPPPAVVVTTPPPPPAPVVVARPAPAPGVVVSTGGYTWSHTRHVVYSEYYGCSDEELYYLERCGYDDDDLLVLAFIARRARVPLRWVVYEFDRCSRNLYTVAMVFNVDPWDFFCAEVPVGYACPGPYGRAYGYYWRRQPIFLTNAECHALIHLQIGVRYYGYGYGIYFSDYDACVRRADPHPFRSVVMKDVKRCGMGGVTVAGTVVVKKDRPWEAPSIRVWEDRRERERATLSVRFTPDHDRREQEKVKLQLDADAHRRNVKAVHEKVLHLKTSRDDDDRRHPSPPVPGRPPVPGPAAKPSKPDRPDPPGPTPAPAVKPSRPEPVPVPAPRRPEVEEGRPERPAPPRRPEVEERKPEKPAVEERKPERPAPPPRRPEAEERKPEKPERPAPPPPPKRPEPEKRAPEPPPRAPERKPEEPPKRPPAAEERKPERKPPPPEGRKPSEEDEKDRKKK
jgi:hypothetical protein